MAGKPNPRFREVGGAILEVVVALAVLVTALMPLSAILANAARLSGRAARMRVAVQGAAAVAATIAPSADYGVGWRQVGEPGVDGLPGTTDDVVAPGADAVPCWRRVTMASPEPGWALVEATCSGRAPGDGAADPDAVVVALMVRS